MYSLDLDALQIGDVVFTADDGVVSSVIRSFTSADYSHVMLCIGHGSCIHADKKGGVHSYNVQRLLAKKPEQLLVKRHSTELTKDQLDEIELFARSIIGTQYSLWDAVKAAPFLKSNLLGSLRLDFNKPSSLQFCSRLVAQAYSSANISLVDNTFSCSPAEIFECEQLKMVENAVIFLDEKALAFARDKSSDKILIQTKVTQRLLDDVRAIYGARIQTLNDLGAASVQIEGADQIIADIVARSGYLDLWQNDIKANPWRYNQQYLDALRLPQQKRDELVAREFASAARELERRNKDLQVSRMNYENYPTATLRQTLELNERLVDLVNLRLQLFTVSN